MHTKALCTMANQEHIKKKNSGIGEEPSASEDDLAKNEPSNSLPQYSMPSLLPVKQISSIHYTVLDPKEIRQRYFSINKSKKKIENDEIKNEPTLEALSSTETAGLNHDNHSSSPTSGDSILLQHGPFPSVTRHSRSDYVVNLTRPVYNPLFLDVVVKILHCVCLRCSRIIFNTFGNSEYGRLIPKSKKSRKERLECALSIAKKTKQCTWCGAPRPAYKRAGSSVEVRCRQMGVKDENSLGSSSKESNSDKAFGKYFDFLGANDSKRHFVSAGDVQNAFSKVSDDDCEKLGIETKHTRPEWLILDVLIVPASLIDESRVSSSNERCESIEHGGKKNEDDLTVPIWDLMKSNEALKRAIQDRESTSIIDQLTLALQKSVTVYLIGESDTGGKKRQRLEQNELCNIKMRGQTSIRNRLHECIQSMAAKVTEPFSGSSTEKTFLNTRVFGILDPNMSAKNVGITKSMAMKFVISETVTTFNLAALQKMVDRGPTVCNGAKCVKKNDGMTIDAENIKLEIGWTVKRYLRSGDTLILQSLHQPDIAFSLFVLVLDGQTVGKKSTFMSVSGVVWISPCLTQHVRWNSSSCDHYWTILIPPSLLARAEAEELLSLQQIICSGPIPLFAMNSGVDSISSILLMTQDDSFLTREEMFSLLMSLEGWNGLIPTPCVIRPIELWTGKQVASLILPDLNPMERKVRDTATLIKGGELLRGVIDRRTIGSIARKTFLNLGWNEAILFLDRLEAVVHQWSMLKCSLSVGLSDMVLPDDIVREADQNVMKCKCLVADLERNYRSGSIDYVHGMTLHKMMEMHTIKIVSDTARNARHLTWEHIQDVRNILGVMIKAKSTMNSEQITSIVTCIGQQCFGGDRDRIPCGFRLRTPPHFTVNDYGAESRGFIKSSYLRGLNSHEFFFHAMAERNTFIKKMTQGNIDRQVEHLLVGAMEKIMLEHDMTLRTTDGQVVQFLYGEDGVDVACTEKQEIFLHLLSDLEFEQTYALDLMEPSFGYDEQNVLYMEEAIYNDCLYNSSVQAILDQEVLQLRHDKKTLCSIMACKGRGYEASSTITMPMNIRTLIGDAVHHFQIDGVAPTDLHPSIITKKLNNLFIAMATRFREFNMNAEEAGNATTLFQIALRSFFATKRVMKAWRLNNLALDWVLDEINARFWKARSIPGNMVGLQAARNLRVPSPPMRPLVPAAGVSCRNRTLYMPRFKELIFVANNIETPYTSIFLDEDNNSVFDNVIKKMECIVLGDIVHTVEIYYDPDDRRTVIEEDKEFLQDYYDLTFDEDNHFQLSSWVLRMKLLRRPFDDSGLRMSDIHSRIRCEYGNTVSTIATDDNANELILRLCIAHDNPSDMNNKRNHPWYTNNLSEILLHGKDEELGFRPVDDLLMLQLLEQHMLTTLQIQGIKGIKNVLCRYFPIYNLVEEEGECSHYKFRNERMLEAEGTNLMRVLCFEGVDATRTHSNDVVEIFNVLGIEAARTAFMSELRMVYSDKMIDYRHLACLVDTMTVNGCLERIARNAVEKTNYGPLLQCAFQGSIDLLVDNAILAENNDIMDGIVQNSMMGQLPYVGTGKTYILEG